MKYILRPLSPHLIIYKTQITSLFSIFHRISGALNVLFFSVFVIYYYFFLYFFGSCLLFLFLYDISNNLILFYFPIIFFFFITFFFHILNGIRHLSWDFCLGLKIKDLSNTANFILISIFTVCFFTFYF